MLKLKAMVMGMGMTPSEGDTDPKTTTSEQDQSLLHSMVTAVDRVDPDVIPQDMLRKYIMYAKEKVNPKLYQIDQDKIAQLYSELRRESLNHGSIPITVRHIESMVHMFEAHARMHLRDYVRADDINVAIGAMLESFIGAQKLSLTKSLRRSFSKYIHYAQDNDELLYYLLCKMVKEKLTFYQYRHQGSMPSELVIPMEEFESQAGDLQIHDPLCGSTKGIVTNRAVFG
ncbi:MCM DNA helicase complex subunit [Dispira simplex]|nr:MCM DNA helicase complex subunit [Dispira simplex]